MLAVDSTIFAKPFKPNLFGRYLPIVPLIRGGGELADGHVNAMLRWVSAFQDRIGNPTDRGAS
jgi:hypothetical protein